MRPSTQYDAENDQLYVAFTDRAFEPGVVYSTLRLGEDVFIDIAEDGTIVGIDLMNASRCVDAPDQR